jgi:hypothetical protein
MKIFLKRKLALVLALMLVIPILLHQNTVVASAAATPSFVKSTVEISGTGETYQLEIKNKVAKSKYKWSSTNTKVAKVSSSGLVTTVNKGTATVKCVITYPSKKTKTLSCKVTVIIPATELVISNVTLVNGAYQMTLGTSMDFNTTLTPANSSDKVYWDIWRGDKDCIRIDDSAEGKVTAIKAGKVVLRARAAKASTKEAANLSIVDDAVIIEVTGPSATVKSADLTSSSEIKVVFDSPVQQSTVIGTNGILSENIQISMRKDTKGVLAKDPGTLKASLSSDNKTLTITSANAFEGQYGINVTSKVLTKDGLAIEDFYKQLSYNDTMGPDIASVTLDDTGVIATINFTEVVNFDNFKVSGAKVASMNGTSASVNTISILNTTSNYVISADKKSVTINLSGIAATDNGKLFSVVISGIKDLSGNLPAYAYLTAYLQTDTSPKPQARLLYVTRTSYNTITATFDRGIQFGGYAQIAGGMQMIGVVDSTNPRNVNYTISDAEAQYTGIKQVNVGYWRSYNVITTDTSANSWHPFNVDFTADKTSPVLMNYEYDASSNILTLTFTEDVKLTLAAGTFSSIYTSSNDDIKPGYNLTYTNQLHTDGNNIIKLKLAGMTSIGNYTFSLYQGFVTDNYRNLSPSIPLTISNGGAGSSSELPAPTVITQSADNPSEIYLYFANKLDKPSAEDINNYKIMGVSIIKAELKTNSAEGATVILTVQDSSIKETVARPLTISGVRGYNNAYGPIISFSTSIELKENCKPTFVNAVYDTVSKNAIRMNFDEQIKGTLTVRVFQTLTSGQVIEIPNSVIITNNYAYINLGTVLPVNTLLTISVVDSTSAITDMSGNRTILPPSIPVLVSY